MGLLRLFLAWVVAVDHFRSYMLPDADTQTVTYLNYLKLGLNAGHAVMLFFVVSGFLISYALENKYLGREGGTVRYAESRFTRIFPLYWFLFVVSMLVAGGWHASALDSIRSLTLVGFDPLFTGGQRPSAPLLLEQAWSLAPEVIFYALAPLIFRSSRIFAVVFALALLARIVLVWSLGFDEIWTYRFVGSTFVFFLLGHVGRLCYRFTQRLGRANILFGLLFIVFVSLNIGREFDHVFFYVYIVWFALFLPYLFDKTKDSPALNFLGDNTYALYMCHALVIHFLYRASFAPFASAAPLTPGGFLMKTIMFLAVCTAVSIALHLLIERRLATLTRYVFSAKAHKTAHIKAHT